MSIASEITRLQQAKSDLATSITNKGMTVPAATTIDGYAALVDSIQQGGGTLPYDAEVEWIGVRQGAFIEYSDYIPTGNGISIDMVATFLGYPTTTNYAMWFAARADSSHQAYRMIRSDADNKIIINSASTTNTNVTYTFSADTTYYIHIDYKYYEITPANGTMTGGAVSTTHSGTANTAGICIGDNSVTRGVNLNIQSFTVRNYGTVVLDYIPVRVGQVGYFYDRIGKKLYGKNANATADLVVGNDKA